MIEVYKERNITIEWAVYRGRFAKREEFCGAKVVCFLVGDKGKEKIPTKECSGIVSINVGRGLRQGTYSLMLRYMKNGKEEQVVKENAFAVTESYGGERGFMTDASGNAVICISSCV